MKLYKAKIKFYFAYSYRRETICISANDVEDAIKKIHDMYDQEMQYAQTRPAFIIRIKEVRT